MERRYKAFRLLKTQLEKALKKKLPLTQIIDAAIAAALKEKVCPYCKQTLKGK